jgi:chorismate mutase
MTSPTGNQPAAALAECRERIDRIDAAVVALLRERVRTAIEAGRAKSALGYPLDSPAREAEVLERLQRLASDPLERDSVTRIFRTIIEETRATQKKTILAPQSTCADDSNIETAP